MQVCNRMTQLVSVKDICYAVIGSILSCRQKQKNRFLCQPGAITESQKNWIVAGTEYKFEHCHQRLITFHSL